MTLSLGTLTGLRRIRTSRIEHAISSPSWALLPSRREEDQRRRQQRLQQQHHQLGTTPCRCCWQQQQQQQRRHQSDHLKQRAIDALKSRTKNDAVAVAADEGDVGLRGGAVGAGGINNRGVGSPPPPPVAATASDADANPPPPATKAAVLPSTPATTSSPSPDDASNSGAGGGSGGAASIERGRTVGGGIDQRPPEIIDHPIIHNNGGNPGHGPIVDANPWAHVHLHEFAPKIVVVGVGGAGTNAVNNMVASGLAGVEFLALNTDAQHLSTSLSPNRLQIGAQLTSGLGCGANPDAGRLAAEESRDAIQSCIEDAHMVFITAGMGGGTGTGAAPVVAGLCYDLGILTVSVVTTPFRFEGTHRRRLASEGVDRLRDVSDSLIVVPNQNLFRLVGEKTSFVESFRLADNVLLAGVRSITDLMTSPGLINLDFADVQSVMHGMGNALLGTGQACDGDVVGDSGAGGTAGGRSADDDDDGADCRAIRAAKMALNNPLLGEGKMDVGSAKGMLVNITGGSDMTLWEVDRAAEYITERVRDPDANIIFGSAYDANLTGCVRVSVVATGIDEG